MIAFESPAITEAQEKLSRAVMSQPYMAGGYTKNVYDVQHTAEDSGDSITPMMLLEPENEEWAARALRLADPIENLWRGRNERGLLQFKSRWFSSERVDEDPAKACDHFYNLHAVQPALLYWQRTGDERLTKLFSLSFWSRYSWLYCWRPSSPRSGPPARRPRPAPRPRRRPGGIRLGRLLLGLDHRPRDCDHRGVRGVRDFPSSPVRLRWSERNARG